MYCYTVLSQLLYESWSFFGSSCVANFTNKNLISHVHYNHSSGGRSKKSYHCINLEGVIWILPFAFLIDMIGFESMS